MGYANGGWFGIRQGIRGVLVQDEDGAAVVWMLVEAASHPYQTMTKSARLPVLGGGRSCTLAVEPRANCVNQRVFRFRYEVPPTPWGRLSIRVISLSRKEFPDLGLCQGTCACREIAFEVASDL